MQAGMLRPWAQWLHGLEPHRLREDSVDVRRSHTHDSRPLKPIWTAGRLSASDPDVRWPGSGHGRALPRTSTAHEPGSRRPESRNDGRSGVIRRRQGLAIGLAGALTVVITLTALHSPDRRSVMVSTAIAKLRTASGSRLRPSSSRRSPSPITRPTPVHHAPVPRNIAVADTTLRLVDPTRTIVVSGRVAARSFATVIRYPIGIHGPFPLIVFGHGYAVTPAPYSDLLNAWTRAGYVVAAPIFPLENANAPGGPDEKDLVNQPADMSLVISSLFTPTTARAAKLAAMIDLRRIAVSGQSDGGDTALAAAFDPSVRDRRIKAAIILSGAEDPFAPAFAMPPSGPPLLAIQGTADTVNPPYQTNAFFQQAAPPKYLLKLAGAGHQAPYTEPGLALATVAHMTLAFLNRYLKHRPQALARYVAAGSAGPGSTLISQQ